MSRRTKHAWLFAVALLGAGASWPSGARADEASTTDKAIAEALFRAGKELSAKGQIAEACTKFAESHRLDPKPGTILNLASCHEQQGKTASAWAEYGEAATLAQRAKQAEREKFAKGKVDEIEKKLSWVVFKFPDVPQLEVQLDGNTLKSAAAGTRMPLDPGEHPVRARAEKKLPWAGTLVVAEGPAERTFEIPMLDDDAPPVAESPVISAPPTPPPPEPANGQTQRLLGWLGVGAGALAIGFGGYFGARTFDEKSTVDDNCEGTKCNRAGYEANDRAESNATFSTIGFVAGGVLVATGIVLLVTAPSARPTQSSRPRGLFRAAW